MRYGLPYQGSKNKIAPWVLEHLPQADTLVDLFAGGCAVTHCAMLSGMFERIIANDITDSVTLFQDALDGKYENESRWISQEDFMRLKDTDPYVRIVWSFGNNQEDYLYSRDIESYKKAVHEMIFAETPNERRLKFKQVIREMEALGVISGGGRPLIDLQGAEALNRVKSITPPPMQLRHEAMERLEIMQTLGECNLLNVSVK